MIDKFKLNFVKFCEAYYDFFLDHKHLKFLKNVFILCLCLSIKNVLLKIMFTVLWCFKWYFFRWDYQKRNVTYEVIGSPGSGKTTFCAFLCKWALHQGYDVFTDVDIKGTYPFSWLEDYGHYDMSNCLIIQDEAGTTDGLDNRSYKKNFSGDDGKARLNMLKRHRHYKQEMYFLSQGEDFEKKVKELCVEYLVLKHTGISWLLHINVYRSEIEVDEMTQEFRLAKKKIKTRFLFTPVVWLTFDTFEAEELPPHNKELRGV